MLDTIAFCWLFLIVSLLIYIYQKNKTKRIYAVKKKEKNNNNKRKNGLTEWFKNGVMTISFWIWFIYYPTHKFYINASAISQNTWVSGKSQEAIFYKLVFQKWICQKSYSGVISEVIFRSHISEVDLDYYAK